MKGKTRMRAGKKAKAFVSAGAAIVAVAGMATTADAAGGNTTTPVKSQAAASGHQKNPFAHAVTYHYNPKAKLGSWENPIILKGTKGIPGLKSSKFPLHSTGMKPNTASVYNNCGISGTYYCNAESTSIGNIVMATSLSGGHEYAIAKGWSSSSDYWVYMDRSSDGGFSWTGHIDEQINSTDWTTPAIYDGPPYETRACLYDAVKSLVVCDAWH
ncbi:hypothetical protein ABZ845_31145 [Streptomyces sp. NPDC047022]|uniref:hypothetical protein n=1 Tax=Streptomyces sp. NPDC047022 TaxID=3155737 RepID=UPI0033F3F4B4